jgi:putative Mg2+ transporter-C (MgtC) family protein
MRRDDPQGVQGMTTATSIWVVAATGVAAGLGMWRAAVIAVALALLLLTLGGLVDRMIHRYGPPDAHL